MQNSLIFDHKRGPHGDVSFRRFTIDRQFDGNSPPSTHQMYECYLSHFIIYCSITKEKHAYDFVIEKKKNSPINDMSCVLCKTNNST